MELYVYTLIIRRVLFLPAQTSSPNAVAVDPPTLLSATFANPECSLINLIMVMSGLLFALFLLFSILRKQNKEHSHAAIGKKETVHETQRYHHSAHQNTYTHMSYSIVLLGLSLMTLATFLLIEDITAPLVLFDRWTVLMTVLFFGQLALLVLAVRQQKATTPGNREDLRDIKRRTNVRYE